MPVCLIAIALATLTVQASPLEPLARLKGVWTGTCSGKPGVGIVTKTFTTLYGGTFVQCDTALKVPATGGKAGTMHEDLSLFSYDAPNQKIRMRQFHNEGFVHTYELKSSTPGHWLFEGQDVENLPAGFRPRLTIDLGSDGSMTEVFSLAAPGKDFSEYVRINLKRKAKT